MGNFGAGPGGVPFYILHWEKLSGVGGRIWTGILALETLPKKHNGRLGVVASRLRARNGHAGNGPARGPGKSSRTAFGRRLFTMSMTAETVPHPGTHSGEGEGHRGGDDSGERFPFRVVPGFWRSAVRELRRPRLLVRDAAILLPPEFWLHSVRARRSGKKSRILGGGRFPVEYLSGRRRSPADLWKSTPKKKRFAIPAA